VAIEGAGIALARQIGDKTSNDRPKNLLARMERFTNAINHRVLGIIERIE
jgi:hypothetical protein